MSYKLNCDNERYREFLDLIKCLDTKKNPHKQDVDKDIISRTIRAICDESPVEAISRLRLDSDHTNIKDILELAVALRKSYIRCFHNFGEPADIQYSLKSGVAVINGKIKKLKRRNKRIFNLLIENVNNPVNKNIVWRAAGRRGKINQTDLNDTYEFNSYITNLRRALGGISPAQLILKKTVELWAVVNLTDKSDLV